MRRTRLTWMVIALLMAAGSCSDKNSTPSGILSREDMQKVLWDMIQADQYAAYLAKDSAHINLKMEDLRLYDQVFQLHHVSREEFSKSYKYYMDHPELTQTLFDSLLAMGNRARNESYSRPVSRPVSTPPVVAPPVGSKRIDSIKKPFAAPVPPIRRPLKNPSSPAKTKLPVP